MVKRLHETNVNGGFMEVLYILNMLDINLTKRDDESFIKVEVVS